MRNVNFLISVANHFIFQACIAAVMSLGIFLRSLGLTIYKKLNEVRGQIIYLNT